MAQALRYRPKALADLDGIATYTRGQWGDEMARAYLETLRSACESLARFPERGMRSLVPGYRRLSVERHAVYYRATKAGVVIVRVLHETQSPRRHL